MSIHVDSVFCQQSATPAQVVRCLFALTVVQVFGLDVEQAGAGRHSAGWNHGRNFGVSDGNDELSEGSEARTNGKNAGRVSCF